MTASSLPSLPGLSGFAVYLPPYRVDLAQWSQWNQADWNKISQVIGHSFRLPAPDQDLYVLAANAVLRLINQYDINPQEVGYLALGTESSSDNAAGAVIVRGLVDKALTAKGLPPLARACEVPEYKHACLGGVYAMKGALRYLAFDGADKKAIVVAADIAEYPLGSSGEPTQGAGACAMLLEANPKLLTLDLHHSGSASDFRRLDFRKPFVRFVGQQPSAHGKLQDLPVFNGKYSTTCYTDETLAALRDLFQHHTGSQAAWYRDLAAVFMHRPYHHMPRSAWAIGYLFALGQDALQQDDTALAELRDYAAAAKVDIDALLAEIQQPANPAQFDGDDLGFEAYPLTKATARAFRKTANYQAVIESKMHAGSERMMALGNLYTAALPAWLAAGLETAAEQQLAWDNKTLVVAGYGSGDAAEIIPAQLVDGWQAAAKRIRFDDALTAAIDITQAQYQALHEHQPPIDLTPRDNLGLHIAEVGQNAQDSCHDFGIARYAYDA